MLLFMCRHVDKLGRRWEFPWRSQKRTQSGTNSAAYSCAFLSPRPPCCVPSVVFWGCLQWHSTSCFATICSQSLVDKRQQYLTEIIKKQECITERSYKNNDIYKIEHAGNNNKETVAGREVKQIWLTWKAAGDIRSWNIWNICLSLVLVYVYYIDVVIIGNIQRNWLAYISKAFQAIYKNV